MSAHWNRFLLLLSTITVWIVVLDAKEVRIVCYYTNWSVYRPGDAKFNPQNINPYLCTHLVYAFGGFTKENTLKPFDKYQDIEKGGYAKFVGLKTYNKNLKTLLAIGGWNEGSTRFSPMVANAERRKELVKNTIKFLRQNHFDGLDLDWEYPSFRDGGKTRDRDNYAQLVQELREEFDRESEKTGRPRLLLTMAVPAGIEYINKGYNIPKLNEYLDWMNILSYDYHSAYEPAVNHHSPLYPIEEENEYSLDIDLNIDYTIKHYLKMGADKSKLVLGIPTYGRSYTLYNPDANEIGSPADGPGEMGEATRENGYLAYYEICENLKSEDWTIEAPYPDAMGPYAYNNNQWVGYDDEEIASKKAEYVAKNGLGGIMFWSIDNDDFRGKCGERPYPIIEAAKEALLKAYGLTDASLLATTKKPIKNRTKIRGTTKTIESTTETSPAIRPRPNSRRKNINRVTEEGKTGGSKRRPVSGRSKKKQQTTTLSSISSLIVTPSYTTPAPPSTPDSGGDFKCEDEGFFPHPKDCKKYFWCLSGPSDLGIVAHQFTCPAGLYFNKAAASCDYTQNVLCNKKLSKSTTTTTTTTTMSPTVASTLSTRKPPPKITAATSRTTVTTTEEPEPEDDYDEEYDEEVFGGSKDAEQDPRVIKELIELIKKAGGIEELEKQLNISDSNSENVVNGNGGGNLDSTTRSTINKSLYERVLGRATATLNEQKKSTFKTYNTIGRNSRGPQNEGIDQNEKIEKSIESPKTRGRPQYTSIIRSRPSTEASDKESKKNFEEDEEEEQEAISEPPATRLRSSPFRKSQPEYVTIRRQRITTTTEINDTEDKESNVDDEENESKSYHSTTSSPYVTIRRSRPTTEKSKDDTNNENIEENITTSRYVELRSRGTTTSTESSSSSSSSPEPSSTQSSIDENLNSVEENTVENTDERNNITELNNVINKTDGLKDVVDNIREIINSQKQEEAANVPVLADPRPFSLNNQKKHTFIIPSTTTTTKTTTTTEDILENQRLNKVTLKPHRTTHQNTTNFRSNSRRRTYRPTTESILKDGDDGNIQAVQGTITSLKSPSDLYTSTESIRKQYFRNRNRSSKPPKVQITTANVNRFIETVVMTDQASDSSNQQLNNKDTETTLTLNEVTRAVNRNKNPQQGPLKLTLFPREETVPKIKNIARKTTIVVTTTPKIMNPTIKSRTRLHENVTPSQLVKTIKPLKYDYFENFSGILKSIPEHSKVLIDDNGVIHCLDQGNFPHPVSCKKFISCARMEGKVLGWEYTCAKNLSFDPIGGLCNWSADLGCDE